MDEKMTDILKIRMKCFLLDKSYVWFVPEEAPILCRYDLDKRLIDFLKEIPQCEGTYSTIVKYKEKLVLIPFSANKVAIFSVEKLDFLMINLPETDFKFRDNMKFMDGFVVGTSVVFIPAGFPFFLKIDMDTLEIKKSSNWCLQYEDYINETDGCVAIVSGIWDQENILYVGINKQTSNDKSCLGVVQLDSLEIQFKKVPYIKTWYRNVNLIGEKLYICSADGDIVIMDKDGEYAEKISACTLKNIEDVEGVYIACTYYHNYLYYYKVNGGVWEFDLKTQVMSQSLLIKKPIIYAKIFDGYHVLVQAQEKGVFYLVDDNISVSKYDFEIDKELKNSFFIKLLNRDNYISESVFASLGSFCTMVQDNLEEKMIQNENIGRQIYDSVNQMISY